MAHCGKVKSLSFAGGKTSDTFDFFCNLFDFITLQHPMKNSDYAFEFHKYFKNLLTCHDFNPLAVAFFYFEQNFLTVRKCQNRPMCFNKQNNRPPEMYVSVKHEITKYLEANNENQKHEVKVSKEQVVIVIELA